MSTKTVKGWHIIALAVVGYFISGFIGITMFFIATGLGINYLIMRRKQ